MSFKDKKYTVIKTAISKELAKFVYEYFCNKRKVARFYFDNGYLAPWRTEFGVWTDEQIPETYSHYGDIAMETLLLKTQSVMEKQTGLNLIPTYSYARVYENGDILHRHKDRYSCEVSTTMNLGGDLWPIFLEPSGEKDKEGIKIILEPGDMLVYKGDKCEHWREFFEGQNCVQVFLHYNNADMIGAETNMYDTRPHLGLPSYFKGIKID